MKMSRKDGWCAISNCGPFSLHRVKVTVVGCGCGYG